MVETPEAPWAVGPTFDDGLKFKLRAAGREADIDLESFLEW